MKRKGSQDRDRLLKKRGISDEIKDLYHVEKSNRACVYIMKDIRALYGFSNSSNQRVKENEKVGFDGFDHRVGSFSCSCMVWGGRHIA